LKKVRWRIFREGRGRSGDTPSEQPATLGAISAAKVRRGME